MFTSGSPSRKRSDWELRKIRSPEWSQEPAVPSIETDPLRFVSGLKESGRERDAYYFDLSTPNRLVR